jgi:hypothetical protein
MNQNQNKPLVSDCVTQAHVALDAMEQAKRNDLIMRLSIRRQARAVEVEKRARKWESQVQEMNKMSTDENLGSDNTA